MELNDSFEVPYPMADVWGVLTDVERIASCLPGAQLTGADGDEFHGLVKVKVGPVTSQYTGKATFAELDESAYRAVVSASGRDSRGAGNASARITVQLAPGDGAATRVSVSTDLTITGKVAQFGRGVLADVSRKLMAQFAVNLAALIDAEQSETADEQAPGAEPRADAGAGAVADADATPAPAPEVEAVDLLAVAGGSVIKRLAPVIVAIVVVVVVLIVVLSA